MEKMKDEKVGPDGGWGYMITASIVIVYTILFGPLQSFGIMFGDFFESLGGKTSKVTLTMSVFFISMSIAGLFANALLNNFSCRQVGLGGAILHLTGTFFMVFVGSLAHILFAYSILQGVAFGVMLPAVLSSFNRYFPKKRFLVFLATTPFTSIGRSCYPLLIYSLRQFFGFRGMLAIISAIGAHSFLAMVILHPVEHHLKTVQDLEMKTIAAKNLSDEKLKLKQTESKNLDLENSNVQRKMKYISDEIVSKKYGCESSTLIESKGQITQGCQTSPPKTISEIEITKSRRFLQIIANFFDLSLFRDSIYVNILMGICFAEFSNHMFLALLPLHLEELGWSKVEIATCISSAGFADLAGAVVLAASTPFYKPKSRYIYLVGAMASVVSRFVIVFLSGFNFIAVVLALIFFFRTWMMASVSMTFAEHCTTNRFPAAFGMFLFVNGAVTLILGSIAGIIRDYSGSYIVCFHFLTVCLLVCCIPWIIEITLIKVRKI